MTGGLGNQFFQYAFGRHLALNSGKRLRINVESFKHDAKRELVLDRYQTDYEVMPLQEINTWLRSYWNLTPLMKKLYRLYLPASMQRFFREELNRGFHYWLLKAKKGFFYGYWADERYFRSSRERILEDLTLKSENLTDTFKESRDRLEEGRSVAIHIRRGDYVSNQEANSTFTIIGIEYYRKAVLLMKEKLRNPVFYVFSDDMMWVKKHLNFPGSEVRYVSDYDLGEDYLEFELMRSCAHFIVANSTFSWWAAWLAENTNKIVICPEKWYVDDTMNDLHSLPESWIRL